MVLRSLCPGLLFLCSGMPGPFDKEREKEKQLAKEKAQAPIKPKNYMEYRCQCMYFTGGYLGLTCIL